GRFCASDLSVLHCFFFFQAEDGIRDLYVTGVQTCALPISLTPATYPPSNRRHHHSALYSNRRRIVACVACLGGSGASPPAPSPSHCSPRVPQIPPRRLPNPFSPSPRPTPSLKSSRPMRPRSPVGRRSMPRPACRSPWPPCPGRRRWLRRPRAA